MRQSLPQFDITTHSTTAPHVFILGAGASRAACPSGDANGKKVPITNEIVDTLGLAETIERAGYDRSIEDFEAFFDEICSDPQLSQLKNTIQERVYGYFASLRLPQNVTLYDQLILALREKDIIATFNWDPFLIQAFRRNIDVARLPKILFLHGTTAVGACYACRVKGYLDQRCNLCGGALEPTRLLYPVRNKDYKSDPFIQNEWFELESGLEQASHVTFFGYSSPAADAAARELMLGRWLANPSNIFAGVEVIDIKSRQELQQVWKPYIANEKLAGFYNSLSQTQAMRHPRRSCEAWFMAIMQGSPWRENPVPSITDLGEFQTWIRHLVEAEGGDLAPNRS